MPFRYILMDAGVSTHSRLKAAGCTFWALFPFLMVSTHSRLKAAGIEADSDGIVFMFQHTAA